MTEPEEFVEPYPASGMRPKLAFGCDRILSSLTVTGAVGIGYLWMRPWAYAIATCIILFGIPVLRKMGRHDPLLVRVALRGWSYERFYSATRKKVGRAKGMRREWLRVGAH